MLSLSLSSVLDPGPGGDDPGAEGGTEADGGTDPSGGTDSDAGEGGDVSRLVTAPELLAGEGPENLEDVYLFPAERVLVLLDRHDGRLWQGEVVEETGFSKAKVSTLLSEMEADGDVDRYWMDGKKVVTLPGVDPEPIE